MARSLEYRRDVFPAVEVLDLRENKWSRPETTGTPPTAIMEQHRSIVVGKRIFVFPTAAAYQARDSEYGRCHCLCSLCNLSAIDEATISEFVKS